jgi:hypothetical protein
MLNSWTGDANRPPDPRTIRRLPYAWLIAGSYPPPGSHPRAMGAPRWERTLPARAGGKRVMMFDNVAPDDGCSHPRPLGESAWIRATPARCVGRPVT